MSHVRGRKVTVRMSVGNDCLFRPLPFAALLTLSPAPQIVPPSNDSPCTRAQSTSVVFSGACALFPALFALLCTRSTVNPFAFRRPRTLWKNHPGGGRGPAFLSSKSLAVSGPQSVSDFSAAILKNRAED